jgi:ABC-type multidrug transport system ATPase subunit
MTTALAGQAPARRPDLALGPALLRGPAPVHLVKDPRTGRRHELGPREHFVLSRLDGSATREEIGAAYAAEFGRRLGDAAWGQLLGLFWSRGLLDTGSKQSILPAAPAPAEPSPRRGLLRGELVLGHPSAFLHRLERRLHPVLRRSVLLPLALALIAADALVLAHLPALARQATGIYHQPSLIGGVFALEWSLIVLHEMAHGLAAVRQGGDAPRVGLRWHLPAVHFYCAVDDVELFPASGRVAAAGAGLLADLATLVPFIVLWEWLPAGDPTRIAAATLLLLINVRIAWNLLPLPPLDGYLMLSHALSATQLATSTLGYARLLLGRDDARLRYPRRAVRLYLGYAALFACVGAGVIAAVVLVLLAETPARYAAAVAGGLALLAAARLAGLHFRGRRQARLRTAAGLTSSGEPTTGPAAAGAAAPGPGSPDPAPRPQRPEETRVPPSPTATPTAIRVEGLSKSYGPVQALRGIDLSVVRGEMFGLLGPNGAGKTTLIEILEGLRQADSGRVSVLGRSPWPRDPALGLRIGVQTQSSAFFVRLTAREHLETVAALYGLGRDAARRVAGRFGVDAWANTRVERLSGGQRQRLALASALVHDPDLLFLDEPTAALDPQARRDLWSLLREVRDQGKTIVYTTHQMDEAEALCDRVAIINDGAVVACGHPRDLVEGLDEPVRVMVPDGRITLGEARALAGVDNAASAGGCVVLATRTPGLVLSAVADLAGAHGVSTRSATLEDVYLKLTGTEYQP